jgi:hypothetical protein
MFPGTCPFSRKGRNKRNSGTLQVPVQRYVRTSQQAIDAGEKRNGET